ncbi:DNA-binding protein [Flavobacterium sediminis]|uniref:DNA-binding protein n=1 Tax=Flavobacterium sediminis TaxID=2201181 RepID=A0A2U8QVI1_9FLAO|nr:Abi family protein [Flavobacterium sediminis]AWM14210.1 DNA-binding protein [Flavobacterium sediminis]
MGNKATNFNEQIVKLEERGMELDYDKDKIKEFLLDIGYYRLGFYWNPFEIDKDHNFAKGTKFSNAVLLYYLDVDLRNILLKYMNRIEINFRTKVVYYASNTHKNSPTWFIDPKVISSEFINAVENHYNDEFKKNNKVIKLHHQKYINDKFAPAWKTLEFFTFGTILKIYKSLLDSEIKKRIANEYGIINIDKFINLMETIVYIRNTCAHGGVLFDLRLPKGISAIPGITFNNNNRHSLDSSIKVILYILEQISNDRKNEMTEKIKETFDKHSENEVLKNIITNEIGYID